MLRAVLDSSILVSAFIAPEGVLSRLLDLALEGRYELFLSDYILDETATALLQPKFARYTFTPDDVATYRERLRMLATLVTALPDLSGAVPEDPKDDMIIATAVAARADYLVSVDGKHLLKKKEYQGIPIVRPREFLERLRGV